MPRPTDYDIARWENVIPCTFRHQHSSVNTYSSLQFYEEDFFIDAIYIREGIVCTRILTCFGRNGLKAVKPYCKFVLTRIRLCITRDVDRYADFAKQELVAHTS